MHRDKVYARLKAKYQNKGLSEKTINKLADTLEVGVTEETQVDEVVDGAEPYLNLIQSEVDIRVAKIDSEKKPEDKGGQNGSGQPEGGTGSNANNQPTSGGDAVVPEWAKPLMTTLQAVVADVNGMKSGTVAKTRREQLEAKLKDAPDALKTKALKDFDRMKFDTDDDFNTYLTETEADLKPIIQAAANNSLAGQHRPFSPTGTSTPDKVKDDIKAWAEKDKKPATTATA